MKMKKTFIIIGIIIIAIIVLIAICITNNKNTGEYEISLLDEITLNDSEKEILSALQDIDYALQNPKTTDEENEGNGNTVDFSISPTEPTSLKKLISNIYEVRKYINEDGEIIFLLDADINFQTDNISKRRIIVTSKGYITSMTFEKEEIDKMEDSSVEEKNNIFTLNFGKDFYESLTNAVKAIWESSIKYENVNYNNILNKI